MNKQSKAIISILIIVLFFILVVCVYLVLAPEAVSTTDNIGQYSSIAQDSNSFLHISAFDAYGWLRYCNNTGGTWSCTNIGSDMGGYTSIAVDSNNKIHISSHDPTNFDLEYCNNTAGSWSCTGVDTANKVGYYSSIAIDSNNKIHISEMDNTNFNLRYCDNTAGSWSCVVADSTNSSGRFSSIAVDSNGVSHISHYDNTPNAKNLRYCNNTGGTWTCAIIEKVNTGGHSSIAVDSNNKIHISAYNGSSTTGNLRYCNNTVGAWNCISVEQPSVDVGAYSSIAVDPNNNIHISHYDWIGYDLRYCNDTAGSWSCAKIADVGTSFSTFGRGLVVKKGRLVDSTQSDGIAHMSYYLSTSTDLYYANITYASLDTTSPYVSIAYPTNITYNSIQTRINFTASDTNIDTCWYSTNAGTTNITTSCTLNITGLSSSQGSNTWLVGANDSAGNKNSNSVTFFIDSIIPLVSIIYPSNNTNSTDTNLDINFTRSDTNLDSCWYSNDTYSANTTLPGCTNITGVTWVDGLHTVKIWVNDTAGNTNSSSVTFRVDTTSPVSTADATPYTFNTWTNNNVLVTIIGYDAGIGFDNTIYPKYCTDTTNTCNPNTFIGGGTTISTEGTSYIRYYSNDTLGNVETIKSQIIKIDSISPINTDRCQNLSAENTIYNLMNNVSSTETCFTIRANNVSLDCNGYEINYSSDSGNYEYGIYSTYNFTTIKNCKIKEGLIAGNYDYGIYFNGTRNGTINNNTITTLGDTGYGIHLYDSSNSMLSNNIITTSDAYNNGYGIYLVTNSNSNIITNNTITTLGGEYSMGIVLSQSSYNIFLNNTIATVGYGADGINLEGSTINTFSNNTISTNSNYAEGIYLTVSDNNTFSNNKIETLGSYSYGIYLITSLTNTFSNNNITTSGLNSNSVIVFSNSNYNTFSNNTITGFADVSNIYLYLNSNNNLSSNTITTFGLNSDGIYLLQSSTNILSNNIITTSGTNSKGVYLITNSNSNTLSNNIITTSNITAHGILLDMSSTNIISNNNITTSGTGRGIYLKTTSSNTFSNNTIATSNDLGYGIFLYSNTNNNSFSGMNVRTNGTTAYSIYIYDTNHNFTIKDSILNSSLVPEIYVRSVVTGGTWNFTNVTKADGNHISTNWTTEANGTLNMKWYFSAQANYTYNTTAASGVNITAYNINNSIQNSALTNSSGQTPIWELIEYMNNGGTETYYTNYTFNATLTNWDTTSKSINLTTNYLNKQFDIIETTLPNATLIYPLNNTYNSTASQNFTFNVSDNLGVKNATLYIYNETGIYNQTNTNFVSDTLQKTVGVIVTLIDSVYKWWVKVWDWAGNIFTTGNYTLTIDTTYPQISYNSNTETNGTYKQTGDIFINVTASDTNKDTVQFSWNNVNETFDNSSGNYYWENKISLAEGTYNFYAWINDSANNFNKTLTRTVYIDLNNPSVSIILPTASSYNYNTSIALNYTASDLNLQSCWWNLDNGANNSITCGQNTTFNTSEATHTLYFYANDSSGRIGTDSVTFSVNLAPPGITLNFPSDNQWLNYKTNIGFNYTPSDTTLDTCEFYINSTGTWHKNQTDTSPTTDVINTFTLSLNEGNYIWNIWCNDTGGNSGWNVINYTTNIDTIYPQISYGSGTEINNYNTTRTWIYVNVSVTEVNENTIIFRLYNSTSLVNSTSSTSSLRIINWTNLVDEFYYYNITINDSAGNTNITSTYKITLDDTKPTLTILNPLSQNYATNDSMSLNYSAIDNVIGMDECWYYIQNSSGSTIKTTETLNDCENDTFTLPGGDIGYNLYLLGKDFNNNIQSTSVGFGIRTVSPNVVLYPSNNTHSPTNNNYFNFTVTTNSDNIDNCSLYGNFNGTWLLNQTLTNPTEGANINFSSLTLLEGEYLWNTLCYDNFNHNAWALNNNTFVVDTTYPIVNITSITSVSGSQTFSFTNNITDLYVNACKYSIYNTLGLIDGLNNNVSFTCNSVTTPTVSAYATYNLSIYGKDKAGNENSSTKEFTTTAGVTTPPGGGGVIKEKPVIVIGKNVSWSMYTDVRGKSYDFFMSKGSSRTKAIIFKNLADTPINLTITCEDIVGGLCDYVVFDNKSLSIPATQNIETSFYFTLTLPDKMANGIYDFNIRATAEVDKSMGKISVRARVGEYGIWGWLVNKLIGKTSFGQDFDVYNFFILIMPFIILAPLMFFVLFRKVKIKFPLTFLICFLVSFTLLFFVGG